MLDGYNGMQNKSYLVAKTELLVCYNLECMETPLKVNQIGGAAVRLLAFLAGDLAGPTTGGSPCLLKLRVGRDT